MSKYDALTRLLSAAPPDHREKRLSFSDIEGLVGPLPASARQYRPWWGNSAHGQALAWQAAGWKVDHVNLTAELVVFVRGQAPRRGGILPVTVRQADPTGAPDRPLAGTPAADEDDHTEASVQSPLAAHLIAEGWQIRRMADTLNREHGIDLLAVKQGRILAVEVKGFPSRFYADPRRGGEIKPTNPSVQARHWYATAVLKALLTHDEHPDYEVAMAFPDVAQYRNLHQRTRGSLQALSISTDDLRDQPHDQGFCHSRVGAPQPPVSQWNR